MERFVYHKIYPKTTTNEFIYIYSVELGNASMWSKYEH